jgi:WD40 repeat protein
MKHRAPLLFWVCLLALAIVLAEPPAASQAQTPTQAPRQPAQPTYAQSAAPKPAPNRPATSLTGGSGLLYLGAYPNKLLLIDEATERVVSEIQTRTGAPRNLTLSNDRTRFYMMTSFMEDIEIVDIASRKIIDSFRLSEGNRKVRLRSFAVHPQHTVMVLLTKSATKHSDRWEIGPNTLQLYDLKEHKVLRDIPWPNNEEREFANLQFSPDGKYLYFFGDDVLIFDTAEYKQVDKWELSRPSEDGLGRVNFNAIDSINDDPGFFTGLFTVQDPVQNRRIMGIGRVDLVGKKIDFTPIGPATNVSFTMAPGRRKAFGLFQEVGRYEFWSFDLENKRVASRQEFTGRPRMALRVSSNGKLLYVFQAGNTIDLYDASSFNYLRTITLDADMTTDLYVMTGR